MGFFNKLNESIKAFKGKGDDVNITPKQEMARAGEGIEELYALQAFGADRYGTFNSFHNRYIQKLFANELERLQEYRQMSTMSEIADVIEDAVNESTQEFNDGYVVKLKITDDALAKNENIVKNINNEFDELFYNRLEIDKNIWNFMRTFFIDGKVFYERIINTSRKSDGIIAMKMLPTETMDRVYNLTTGKTEHYYQYLAKKVTRPRDRDEAEKSKEVIVFNKEQIGYIDYGNYGVTRNDVLGYLEKARIPYNQLKLLETSVVIYRIIRAPERFVFEIDTGNMPKDKAMKFVDQIKRKINRKQTYDASTGRLTQETQVLSMLENFYLPKSGDGRGSQVTTVGGGGTQGFTELDDIYYFSRKLYRSLKYPISRIDAAQEKRSGDVLFGGQSTGEIARDEVKWAKFLEIQQKKICREFLNLFLLHMEFRGLKEKYGLEKDNIDIEMTPPSHYKEQMDQNFLETQMNNYQNFANNPEFSKSYLMKRYLNWTEEEIKENWKGFQVDDELNKEYKPKGMEDEGFGGGF